MGDFVLVEGIYVKRSNGKFGGGGTYRECILETMWFPKGVEDGLVELFPVTLDMKRILNLQEKVTVETFKKEYSLREDSRDIYIALKSMIR
ncbi:MAG: hypothetical protein HY758_01080 [Nitrospirae bacterium]|nr:hypothetical protein [Nitrospirota bacterium]